MFISEYKNIIWDWNGTLLDDVWFCADIMNNLLQRRSLPGITLNHYKDIFTFPVKDYYIAAGLSFENESFEVIGKEFMDEYEERKYICELFPYAKKELEIINDLEINQYLLSAYKQENLVSLVEEYGLINYFEIIKGLDHIYADGKVELGKELMAEISSTENGASTLLIGDTLHDYDVATGLGTDCLLITSGHQNLHKMNSEKINIIESMEHLYSITV